MFRPFLAACTLVTTMSTLPFTVHANRSHFEFDRDTSPEDCNQAKLITGSDEEFRLFCINEAHAFEICAISCSEALEFEGTVATSRRPQDFYDLEFTLSPNKRTGSKDGEVYDMNKHKGTATVFSIIPLRNSQAQYFYELLEDVQEQFSSQTVKILAAPMLIEEEITMAPDPTTGKVKVSGVAFDPYHENQRVTLLAMTTPETIGSHPFLGYLPSLYLKSGFEGFDVYTDRAVVFVISSDGRTVERIVMPSKKILETTIKKHISPYSSKEF